MARFLVIWLLSLCATLLLVGTFCALVDPYAVLGSRGWRGLTANKPASAEWPRLTKPYTIGRAQARTLILGASTVDVGFDPGSTVWTAGERPVFNMGIDGATPSLHFRFMQHALAQHRPERILLGISFIDCLIFSPPQKSGAPQDDARLQMEQRLSVSADGTPNPHFWQGRVADLVFATLSLTAVGDSIGTLLHQNDPFTTYQTALGWNTGGAFRRWAMQDGYGGLFADKERTKFRQLRDWRASPRMDLQGVARIVAWARAANIPLTILIMPNHADAIEAIAQLGLQDVAAQWRRDLVQGVDGASGAAVPVWDFSGISPYTTEEVPPFGNRAVKLRWFYEPVHFQPALADVMINALHANGSAEPGGFGRRLSLDSLAADEALQRARLSAWEQAHPDDVARVRAALASLPKS